MIRNLPTSLIESANKVLSEAVALKSHKDMAIRAAKSTMKNGFTEAERISGHVIPHGQSSITIPLERENVEPHPEVKTFLDSVGYDVHDYKKGLAIKKGDTKNATSIGKILSRSSAPASVKTTYEKDPNRQGIDSRAKIVITRDPVQVAGMSTHQEWESCQTLGGAGKDHDGSTLKKQEIGGESSYVPKDIAAGTHVAYLVHNESDVDKHFAPIARIALKPYINKDTGHTVLRPMKSYGDEWGGFHQTVSKWADQHFPMMHAEYDMHGQVYPDGAEKVRNFSPEHDTYWKSRIGKDTAVESMHPSPDVLHTVINHANDMTNGVHRHIISRLYSNPHIQDQHIDRLMHMEDAPTPYHLINTSAHRGLINRYINSPNYHGDVVNNPHLTGDDLDKLWKHHRDTFSTESNQVTNNVVTGIASHPNVSKETANDLLHTDRIREYVGPMAGMIKNGDTDAVRHFIHGHIEDDNTNSWHYYDRQFASIAQHKPEVIPEMHNLMLHYANHGLPSDSEHARNVHHEMIRRNNPAFDNALSYSKHKDVLQHVIEHGKEEVKGRARANLANLG